MFTSGTAIKNQLTATFATPPASIDQTGQSSCPVACRTAVVMSEMHTNTDAMPSKNSSVGPAALLRG